MKKRLGIMVVMGAVLMAGVSFWAWRRHLDETSFLYVKKTVPVVFERWTSAALIKEVSPQLLIDHPAAQIEQLFVSFSSQYGNLKAMHRPDGRVRVRLNRKGISVRGSYLILTSYEKADVAIHMLLEYRHGKWQVAGFHIMPVKKSNEREE